MKNTKQLLRNHLLTTLTIYTVGYLSGSFSCWELINPIKWIIDLPTYENVDRAIILFAIVSYHGISLLAWDEILKSKS